MILRVTLSDFFQVFLDSGLHFLGSCEFFLEVLSLSELQIFKLYSFLLCKIFHSIPPIVLFGGMLEVKSCDLGFIVFVNKIMVFQMLSKWTFPTIAILPIAIIAQAHSQPSTHLQVGILIYQSTPTNTEKFIALVLFLLSTILIGKHSPTQLHSGMYILESTLQVFVAVSRAGAASETGFQKPNSRICLFEIGKRIGRTAGHGALAIS